MQDGNNLTDSFIHAKQREWMNLPPQLFYSESWHQQLAEYQNSGCIQEEERRVYGQLKNRATLANQSLGIDRFNETLAVS